VHEAGCLNSPPDSRWNMQLSVIIEMSCKALFVISRKFAIILLFYRNLQINSWWGDFQAINIHMFKINSFTITCLSMWHGVLINVIMLELRFSQQLRIRSLGSKYGVVQRQPKCFWETHHHNFMVKKNCQTWIQQK
jgi:hypothetical protein